MTRYRALQAAGAPTMVEGDGRTVRIRLVAWGVPSTVTDDGGRTWYRESFARGGLQAPPDANVVLAARAGHKAEAVGRIVAVDDLEDGLYADVRMDPTTAADLVIADIDNPDRPVSVSAEFDDFDGPAGHGDTVQRSAAVLTGVAFTDLPQHTTAAVIGRRSHEETTTMPEEQNPAGEPTTEPAATTTPAAPEPASHERGHEQRPDPTPAHRRTATPVASTSRFRSFGEFARAAAEGRLPLEERQRFYRALQVADTDDTTMQVQWITDVIDLVRASQPTVQAFSTRPLPEYGETVSQPAISQRPTIAAQAAEGDAVSSTKAIIAPVSWTVGTYGGGQGISIQTVMRSQPAYLNELMRLYAIEGALELEETVAAGVLAAADDVHTAIELSNTETDYVDAFVDAAATILGAVYRMPEVIVGNIKMWQALAKATDSSGRPLFPGISPLNPVGRMDLSTSDGEVRGLPFVCAPKMSNTRAKAVVGVRDAYRSMISSMGTLQADVPETLTQERAVYWFAAHGKVDASGLVLIDNAS